MGLAAFVGEECRESFRGLALPDLSHWLSPLSLTGYLFLFNLPFPRALYTCIHYFSQADHLKNTSLVNVNKGMNGTDYMTGSRYSGKRSLGAASKRCGPLINAAPHSSKLITQPASLVPTISTRRGPVGASRPSSQSLVWGR